MFDNLGKAVLWWSSGLDSTLLLAMLIEANVRFDVVHMRDHWTREQLKRADALIQKWNLKTFSYPPSSVSFIGDDELTTVFEYAVGDAKIPMLRDVVDGTKCIAELDGHRMYVSPFEWDTYIVGSRKDDTHWVGQVVPSKRWELGGKQFYAPLFDWTREEVVAKSLEYGLDVDKDADEGDIHLCTKCLNGVDVFCPLEKKVISPVQWDRHENTKVFRESYGV